VVVLLLNKMWGPVRKGPSRLELSLLLGIFASCENASYAVKTFLKTVVAAMTDTTQANGRVMMFMTGLSCSPAMIVWIKLAANAKQKYDCR